MDGIEVVENLENVAYAKDLLDAEELVGLIQREVGGQRRKWGGTSSVDNCKQHTTLPSLDDPI